MHPEIAVLVHAWARSKGVGLKTALKRCLETRKQRSNASRSYAHTVADHDNDTLRIPSTTTTTTTMTTTMSTATTRHTQQNQDRVEMLCYHLTGEFGLRGEANTHTHTHSQPHEHAQTCSGSITMWGCPEVPTDTHTHTYTCAQGTAPLQPGECAFNTPSVYVYDVLGSGAWEESDR